MGDLEDLNSSTDVQSRGGSVDEAEEFEDGFESFGASNGRELVKEGRCEVLGKRRRRKGSSFSGGTGRVVEGARPASVSSLELT